MHISISKEHGLQVQYPGLDALEEAAQRATAPRRCEKLDVRINSDRPCCCLALQCCCSVVVRMVPAHAKGEVSWLKLRCKGQESARNGTLQAEICGKEVRGQAGVKGYSHRGLLPKAPVGLPGSWRLLRAGTLI